MRKRILFFFTEKIIFCLLWFEIENSKSSVKEHPISMKLAVRSKCVKYIPQKRVLYLKIVFIFSVLVGAERVREKEKERRRERVLITYS